jgi:hypothetical protein
MVNKAIKMALEKIDKKYCRLSQKDYATLDESIKETLRKEKYLERPVAYEFYHQLRTLMDKGVIDFCGPIIQAEVDKNYQHCFENGKIPDFIIHVPNRGEDKNLAVIEFKLANNLHRIEEDFKKLVKFKEHKHLKYSHAVEVIIGDESSLRRAKKLIRQMNKSDGEEIIIIEFDTDSWKANDWKIRYSDVCNKVLESKKERKRKNHKRKVT